MYFYCYMNPIGKKSLEYFYIFISIYVMFVRKTNETVTIIFELGKNPSTFFFKNIFLTIVLTFCLRIK